MIHISKNKISPLFCIFLSIAALLMAMLACENEKESIDLTEAAPQNLSSMDFSWKAACCYDFSGKDMRNVLLTGAEISNSNFTNTDLRGADLSEAQAYDVIFDGADLRGAKLDRLCFEGSSWKDAKLDSHWQKVLKLFEEKLNLSNLCMYSYDLQNVNLNGADLSGTILAWADLTGADLQNVNLKDARLGTTNLAKANLTGAIVTEEQLADAILCKTITPDGQISNEGCDRLSTVSTP